MEDTRPIPDVGTPAGTRLDAPQRDLGEILERLLDEAEGESSSAPPPPPSGSAVPPASADAGATVTGDTAVPVSPPVSEGGISPLAGLLSNPALLSALPTVMENLSPLLGNLNRGVGSSPSATRPHTVDRHTALLCAIKPYLSPRRQEAAETVIRLCRVWDALERSGIHVGDLLGGLGHGVTGESSSVAEGRRDHVQ